jgi:hypothetical protein
VDKAQVLLSELSFTVDGEPASLDLGEGGDRLVWTGRLEVKRTAAFHIRYRARGLESFVYRLDPALPAHDVDVRIAVAGGDNVDYPSGVLAASTVERGDSTAALAWSFPSLESGVALGVILLPGWPHRPGAAAPTPPPALGDVPRGGGLRLHLGAAGLPGRLPALRRRLGAGDGGDGHGHGAYLKRLFPEERAAVLAAGRVAAQVVPTLAVLLQGYTGLVYTLELLAGLLALMVAVTHPRVRALLSDRLAPGGAG